MLLRYPGKGNSIPSLRTVATSVPFPPVGPPPAFGASVLGWDVTLASVGAVALGGGATFPFVGVARAGVFGAGLALGSGISLSVDCVAVGCVTDVLALDSAILTSPIALSPGGAATISTRYIGGSATGLRSLSVLKRSVATTAWSMAESVRGATSGALLSRRGITSPRVARPPIQCPRRRSLA